MIECLGHEEAQCVHARSSAGSERAGIGWQIQGELRWNIGNQRGVQARDERLALEVAAVGTVAIELGCTVKQIGVALRRQPQTRGRIERFGHLLHVAGTAAATVHKEQKDGVRIGEQLVLHHGPARRVDRLVPRDQQDDVLPLEIRIAQTDGRRVAECAALIRHLGGPKRRVQCVQRRAHIGIGVGIPALIGTQQQGCRGMQAGRAKRQQQRKRL